MMKVKIVFEKTAFHIFSGYAPQVGRYEEENIEFWERFQDKVVGVPISEGVIIGGVVNGHIRSSRVGYKDVMGHFVLGNQNTEGGTVLDFCRNHQLEILNTYFKKDREKYITYKSGAAEMQLDLILIKKMDVCVTVKPSQEKHVAAAWIFPCRNAYFKHNNEKMEGNEKT